VKGKGDGFNISFSVACKYPRYQRVEILRIHHHVDFNFLSTVNCSAQAALELSFDHAECVAAFIALKLLSRSKRGYLMRQILQPSPQVGLLAVGKL